MRFCAVWYEMVTGTEGAGCAGRMKKDTLKPPSEYVVCRREWKKCSSGDCLWRSRDGISVWGICWRRWEIQRERRMKKTVGSGRTLDSDYHRSERGSAREEKRSRVWRWIKRASVILLVFLGVAGAGMGGLWIYARTYPEKVLAYRLKKDRAEMMTSEWKTVEMRGSKEYKEAIDYLEEHAYEVRKDEMGARDYSLLQPAMEDWEYSEDPGECFAVKEDTAAMAVEIYLGEYEEKESSFYGAVYVSTLPSYPISTTAQQTDTYRYGDRSAEICFDEKTGWVNEISLRIEKGEIEKLLPKFLYVLAPETALSDEEIQELLAYLKKEEDSVYIELNANCYLGLYLSEENVVLMDIRSR